MTSPPKKARGELASTTARKPITSACYAALTPLANVFGSSFCFFEQRRWRMADRFNDERSAQ
jgi:hypothetical protein